MNIRRNIKKNLMKKNIEKLTIVPSSDKKEFSLQTDILEYNGVKNIKKQISEYWNLRFKDFYLHHSKQNIEISKDFLINFDKFDFKFDNVIEIGCGTGELSHEFYNIYKNIKAIGLDISKEAILFANNKYSNNNLLYYKFNCLENSIRDKFGDFDLSISSNTLEHFKDPFKLLENMLSCSKKCIIIVPYKQILEDGYLDEGGAGHVYSFNENTFNNYNVIKYFIFSTNGWQYSSSLKEIPLQIAFLIKGYI